MISNSILKTRGPFGNFYGKDWQRTRCVSECPVVALVLELSEKLFAQTAQVSIEDKS